MKRQVEQLVVTCKNGIPVNPGVAKNYYYQDGKVKKFSGTIFENPIEHLNYLKSILDDLFWTDGEKLRVTEASMRGAALLWWRTTHQSFKTFQQFEDSFKNEFWDVFKQCETRTRLYADKYREEGTRSLEEHFVVNWERSRHL